MARGRQIGEENLAAFCTWTAFRAETELVGGDRLKQIASMDTFCARFSNRGVTVALTAPGVAVVSTFLAIGGG